MNIEELYAHIQSQLDQQLPFVIYRKPEENTIYSVLQNNADLHTVNSYDDSGFIFAPFDTTRGAILIPDTQSIKYQTTIAYNDGEDIIADKHTDSINLIEEEDTSSKKLHLELVKHGIHEISKGTFEKVVLSRKEETPFSDKKRLQIFRQLIANYPTAFVYFWYHPKIGTWLGATPEVLVKIKGDEFVTMALAGTQPYVDSMKVAWGRKEIEEQAMVTDFVLKQVSKVVTDVTHSETYTHKAGTLLHLRTDIKGILKGGTSVIKDIIAVLHPTPAVCGLPKKEATTFIVNNETYDRSYYTGFLGELNVHTDGKTTSDLFVNLRCMQIRNEYAVLYVGGGITKDSDPEKEWEETVRKTATMKKVLS
ncbi:chorismate-binding protein [Aquimarina addita]|uniref:isochorismate synthase n=1 Tax=Aquimarina addita TaxID=870485 RepID=A0ABP7XFN5_9FLAO